MNKLLDIIVILMLATAITHVLFTTASKSFCTTDTECCVAYDDCVNANE